jgi:hypothetical protein
VMLLAYHSFGPVHVCSRCFNATNWYGRRGRGDFATFSFCPLHALHAGSGRRDHGVRARNMGLDLRMCSVWLIFVQVLTCRSRLHKRFGHDPCSVILLPIVACKLLLFVHQTLLVRRGTGHYNSGCATFCFVIYSTRI